MKFLRRPWGVNWDTINYTIAIFKMHFSEARLVVDVTAHIVVKCLANGLQIRRFIDFLIFFTFIGRVTNNEERKFAQRLFE